MHTRLLLLTIPLMAGVLSSAQAAGFLVSGGSMAGSSFCRVYGCTLVSSSGGQKAYQLKKSAALGVVSQVSGGRVGGMSLVIKNPDTVSDTDLQLALNSALPDFEVASLGARHAFKVSAVCLKNPTPGKTITVAGNSFGFSCRYGPQAAVAGLFRLAPSTPLIVVSYTRP